MTTALPRPEDEISRIFNLIGQPVRIQILLLIAGQEACVCHLEAHLGLRQAAISQHLMLLRDAGLVTTNRDGRNIYYRLAKPELLEVIRQTAKMAGISIQDLQDQVSQPVFPCPCPHCNPEKAAGLDCGYRP
jgi:DNA-binding transcriptional ArsR family regulator